MIMISHRGNVWEKKPKLENSPMYLNNTMNEGYDCEIDVWYDGGWWLGHDGPEHKTDLDYLTNGRFWIHCKNMQALVYMQNTRLNYFWHDNDDYTLTSHGYIWAYPRKPVVAGGNSICVLPEIDNTPYNLFNGVCSDVIGIINEAHTIRS